MEDIIKVITDAEERAAEIKAQAQERAAEILENASRRAEEILRDSETKCKILREVSIRQAEEDAESAYDETLKKSAADAKKYADGVIKTAEGEINAIVGRVAGGNR